METQNKIINNIVTILSKEDQVDKIIFFGDYLPNGMPYEVTLIIYENCNPDYMISQEKYEKLLKTATQNISLNVLAVNSEEAKRSLDQRLINALCIYEKKVKK